MTYGARFFVNLAEAASGSFNLLHRSQWNCTGMKVG